MDESYLGVVPDPRSKIDKDKDFQQEEVLPMAIVLNWNRDISGAPSYSLRDQDGSGSCVGQSSAKALETITNEIQSAHPIYRRRANFPSAGMYLHDAGDIIRHKGTTTELLDPSQRMTEAQMNEEVTVPTPLTEPSYIMVNVKDIDAIATAIETQKHCLITFYGTLAEYANVEKPIVIPSDNLNCAHCICGVYYFKDDVGNKCILADESWGPDHIRRRILTEDYLRARGTGAMYFVPPAPVPVIKKPKYNFKTPLLYGQKSEDIKALQDILKYEKLFPLTVESTGLYLSITVKGVLAWQIKHKVAPLAELNSLQGKRVGEKTIKALNLIYGSKK